jgi:uncharacterized protein (TIGR01244 family)
MRPMMRPRPSDDNRASPGSQRGLGVSSSETLPHRPDSERDRVPPTPLPDLITSLPYGACPRDDVATAGQPTAAQMGALARAGVRTVLDLRAAPEPRGYDEAGAVRAVGMEYVLIPVTPETLDDATFDRFLAVMRDRERRPVLVHCATANRVGGLLIPFFRIDEGMTEEASVALAQRVGLRSAEYAAKALDYARRHGAG